MRDDRYPSHILISDDNSLIFHIRILIFKLEVQTYASNEVEFVLIHIILEDHRDSEI